MTVSFCFSVSIVRATPPPTVFAASTISSVIVDTNADIPEAMLDVEFSNTGEGKMIGGIMSSGGIRGIISGGTIGGNTGGSTTGGGVTIGGVVVAGGITGGVVVAGGMTGGITGGMTGLPTETDTVFDTIDPGRLAITFARYVPPV
jgi:hypothetical protein